MASGERDLQRLVTLLEPALASERYSFEPTVSPALDDNAFALIRESEGLTAICPREDGGWARISIGVHSDLQAVGLTALLSRRLADAGISANVVAALYHDHIFVPWGRAEESLRLLQTLA